MMLKKNSQDSYLLKHTAAIHISNDLNLSDRKIYNVLIQNAFRKLLNVDTHLMSIDTLLKELGHPSYTNYTFIKESIKKLVDTSLRLNILGKDKKKKWESAISLLSSAHFSNGMIYYSFPKELAHSLAKPNIYASLNLKYQAQLSSKYTIALWEYCTEQLDSKHCSITQTNILPLSKLRELLGARDKSYDKFKAFSKSVLKKSVNEINTLTDLIVTFQPIKEGRKITGVVFDITRKSLIFDNQANLFDNQPDIMGLVHKTLEEQEVINKAIKLGIQKTSASELLKNFSPNQFLEALELIELKIKKGQKIDNVPGYIWKILEKGIYKNLSSEEVVPFIKQKDLFELEEKVNPHDNKIVQKFLHGCKNRWGEGIYKSWILHLNYLGHNDNSVVFSVGTNFIKNWIETNYLHDLLQIWQEHIPSTEKITIQVSNHIKP